MDNLSGRNSPETKSDDNVTPKLRKNRKFELRWGQQYYAALKEIVFTVKPSSYVPAEVPKELRIETEPEEPLHVCKQCNDSFRLKSSLEDHEDRKSWILGYWCHHCFHLKCNHTQEEKSMCLPCQNIENKNRARLSRRGLKRGQKMGSVQVFYNQCQFFAHLKYHNTTTVDMAYIMLMPIPSKVQSSEYPQLHEACKAVMEHSFVKQKHIMDFLRIENAGPKWWLAKPSDSSLIGRLLEKYYTDSCDELGDNGDGSDQEDAPPNSGNNLPAPADITFVDCGPTARAYIPAKSKIGNFTITKLPTATPKVVLPVTTPTTSSVSVVNTPTSFFSEKPSLSLLHKDSQNTSKNIIKKFPNLCEEKKPASLISLLTKPSTSSGLPQVEQTEKKSDDRLSALMSQLPEELRKNNNITIINKNGEKAVDQKNSPTVEKNTTPVAKNSSTVKTPVTASASPPVFSKTTRVPERVQPTSIDGKLLLQKGQKLIIKQVPPLASLQKVTAPPQKVVTLVPVSSANLVKKNEGSTVKPTARITAVPQGRKTKVDCFDTSQEPTFNFKKTGKSQLLSPKVENGKLFLCRKFLSADSPQFAGFKSLKPKITNVDALIEKYQARITKNLQYSSKQRIQTIIDNLRQTSTNFSKSNFVDSEQILAVNSTILSKLEKYLKMAPDDTIKTSDRLINEEYRKKFINWEDPKLLLSTCQKCKKKQKPKNYLVGISKSATDEENFCQCYNYICHLCHSRQGGPQRYKAHQKFHKTEEPYSCPDCFAIFDSIQGLETHIWTKCFHIMTQQVFTCRVCEIEGFLTMEDLTRHYYEVHCRSTIVCPECQRIMPSYCEFLAHHSDKHPQKNTFRDPDTVIICDFGGCMVLPESFRLHMEKHPEIGKITYYTCPFCSFYMKKVKGNESAIQNHVFKEHADRLSEVITPDTLTFFRTKFKLQEVNPKRVEEPQEKIILPRIVGTCSIAPTLFEQVPEKTDEEAKRPDKTIPRIISVKTVKPIVDNSSQNGITVPRIVDVKSINPNANSNVSNVNPPRKIFMMSSKNSRDVTFQTSSGKTIDIPVSFVTGSNKNRVMLKLNLLNGSGSQGGDKKFVLYKSNPGVSKPPESIVVTSTTPLPSPPALTAISQTYTALKAVPYSTLTSTTVSGASSTSTSHATPTLRPVTTSQVRSIFETRRVQEQTPKTDKKSEDSEANAEVEAINAGAEARRVVDKVYLASSDSPTEINEENLQSEEAAFADIFKTPKCITANPTVRDESSRTIAKIETKPSEQVRSEDKDSEFWTVPRGPRRGLIGPKRRGRPKKPWRIALNGPEGPNFQPLNFKCHVCSENITTSWEVIKNHFATRHFREYKLCVVTPKLRKLTDMTEIEDADEKVEPKKRKLESVSSPSSRRKRKLVVKKSDDNSTLGICVRQEKVEEVEGNFKCKKCEELFKDIDQLREHIANTHRIKPHYLVCLECGENFFVANSLQMHLKAFHGIVEVTSYLAKNPIYAPDITGSCDGRTIEPNQCYVCMAVFEDKAAVDKHLRVHGMAFLNRTRIEARNASMVDEKKIEPGKKEEDAEEAKKIERDNESSDASILTRISKLLS